MRLLKTKILVAVFSIATLLDFGLALAVKLTKPFFNESNPIYIATGSLWPLFFVKLVGIVVIYYFLVHRYRKTNIYARYFIILFVVIGTIAQIVVLPGAINELLKEPARVVDVPVKVRQESYKQAVAEPIGGLYLSLFLAFIVWRLIEKEQIENDR